MLSEAVGEAETERRGIDAAHVPPIVFESNTVARAKTTEAPFDSQQCHQTIVADRATTADCAATVRGGRPEITAVGTEVAQSSEQRAPLERNLANGTQSGDREIRQQGFGDFTISGNCGGVGVRDIVRLAIADLDGEMIIEFKAAEEPL